MKNEKPVSTFDNLIAEILQRFPHLQEWARSEATAVLNNGQRISPTLAIIHPEKVHPQYHRIVHDYSFRERARELLEAYNAHHGITRVCVAGDNGVLVLCPAV